MSAPRLRSSALLPAAFVLLAATVFWCLHNGEPRAGARPIFSDLVNYYHPMADLVARRIASGELPLWNPTACGGLPLLATLQVAVFYPPNWLAPWLGAETALALSMYLHCVLGGWFACWAFRAGGSEWSSAAFGGALFVFACVVGETGFPPQAAAIVWLPWLLLCVERGIRTPSLRWGLGLAAGTALQLLAGFPQFVLLSFYLVGSWALVATFEHGRAREASRVGTLAFLAAAVLLGVGLAGVQLVPSLELANESMRADALSRTDVHYLGSDVPRLSGLLYNAFDPTPRRLTFDYGTGAGYLGVAPLLLVLLGIAAGWRRATTGLLVVVAGLSLALSDGYRGVGADFYALYAKTPGAGLFRTPERFRLLYLFSVIALAVRGFDELARGFPVLLGPVPRRWRRIGIAAGGLVVAAAAVALGPAALLWRLAALLPFLAVVLVAPGSASVRRIAALAALTLAVIDLGLAVGHYGFFRRLPLGFAAPPPARFVSGGNNEIDAAGVARLQEQAGHGRVELVRFMPKLGAGALAGLHRVSCFEPLVPAPWPRVFEALGAGGGSGVATVSPADHPDFYDLASVARLALPGREGVVLEDNPDALGRAYLVEDVALQRQAEIFEQLAAGQLDYRGRVALEREPGWQLALEPGTPGKAVIARYEAERVVIDVRSERDAVLVLTDSHYPGWRARVDGEEVAIARANGLFRAVPLRAGARQVDFEYAPASFRLGAAVSGSSIAIAAAIAWMWARRRRGEEGA